MIGLFRRSMGAPIHLETPRFVLTSLSRRELAAISLPWTADPAIMEPLELQAGGWSLRRWRKQVVRPNNRDRFAFAIRTRADGGIIGYETAQISRTGVAILGVVIGDKSWWGRGVVVETRVAVLTFLFQTMQCARAWGVVYARNFPSISNYLALGFTHEGTLRQHFRLADGTRADAMVFGLTRQEWEAKLPQNGAA
ncbi:MAG: GNAT family N-acetyltransferase [Hyphomicrobiales bacterium]|nr:GNAT family N-acetyltransferase [Hyphomicrobiales bacterium]